MKCGEEKMCEMCHHTTIAMKVTELKTQRTTDHATEDFDALGE
jgi:hypothetical protein